MSRPIPSIALLVVLLFPSITRAADLESLAWLVGDWRGEDLGGAIQEVWLPAAGGAMHAVFRLVVDDRLVFSEYVQTTVHEDEVVMRFSHFRPDYSTWEAERGPVEMRLTASGDDHALFEAMNEHSPDRIEYRRREDGSLAVEVTGIDHPLVFRRHP